MLDLLGQTPRGLVPIIRPTLGDDSEYDGGGQGEEHRALRATAPTALCSGVRHEA